MATWNSASCNGCLLGPSYLLSKLKPLGIPSGSAVKDLSANARDVGDTVWSLSGEDPLEKGMATHSSILAWRIPWTEDPGGLQSMGSQRVRHDWSDLARMQTFKTPVKMFWVQILIKQKLETTRMKNKNGSVLTTVWMCVSLKNTDCSASRNLCVHYYV